MVLRTYPESFRVIAQKMGSIQESRPTRGSFRGSFCGSFSEVSASFAEVSAVKLLVLEILKCL